MTEQDFFNDHQDDAQRFSNFVRVVIVVVAVMVAMIVVNVWF